MKSLIASARRERVRVGEEISPYPHVQLKIERERLKVFITGRERKTAAAAKAIQLSLKGEDSLPPGVPTALVCDASQRGRDAVKARKPKDVDQALQDTTAALRGSDFMHKFSGESDALLEAFLESGPAPIPQQDA